MTRLKIFIVDDHLLIIEGMKKQISTLAEVELLGIASNSNEALAKIDELKPELIIFDYELPGMTGLELFCTVKNSYSNAKGICYTMHSEPWIMQKLIKSGVDGIVLKTDMPETLNIAIKTVFEGKKYIPSDIMSSILTGNTNIFSDKYLTDREVEVLKLIAQELSTKEIADRMNLSENTIESYRKNLLIKLNAKNMAGLVLKGMQLGLI